jgi:hypothetical protein
VYYSKYEVFSLLLLHQSLPGDGSQQRPLLPCSRSYRLATVPQQTPTLLTTVSRFFSNGSLPSLHSLGTDPTENAASNRSSIAACVSVATITSNGRCLQSHYLATVIVLLLISRSLPSNGSKCHNIKIDLREIGRVIWTGFIWLR